MRGVHSALGNEWVLDPQPSDVLAAALQFLTVPVSLLLLLKRGIFFWSIWSKYQGAGLRLRIP